MSYRARFLCITQPTLGFYNYHPPRTVVCPTLAEEEMAPEARFAVVSRTGAFDFTPAFEDAVLRIVPSALFLVVALQRLFWLARQPRKVAKTHQSFVKVARNKLPL
jgi:hypothetical protein